ncbi:MAG: biopolymer transporter ExbD [Phycisphaerales bacterium]|nr:biopolymer transporter ExbD [Phycisphaerales bacterium]
MSAGTQGSTPTSPEADGAGGVGGSPRVHRGLTSPRRRRGGAFRRRDALHGWTLHFGPNMTPMVDVVMVILIFFMASAAFMGNEWFLQAALPAGAGGPKAAAKKDPLAFPPTLIKVGLDAGADGATVASWNGEAWVGVDAVIERVQSITRGMSAADAVKTADGIEITVLPTARVPYRDVVRVQEACESAGLFKVGLGVTPTPAAPK